MDVWILRFALSQCGYFKCSVKMVRGSGSGFKRAPAKKKAPAKKSPSEKKNTLVKKAPAKKKAAKKGEGSTGPSVHV